MNEPRDLHSKLSMRRDAPEQDARRLRRGAYLLPSAFTRPTVRGYACSCTRCTASSNGRALIGIAIVLDMLDAASRG